MKDVKILQLGDYTIFVVSRTFQSDYTTLTIKESGNIFRIHLTPYKTNDLIKQLQWSKKVGKEDK